MSRPVTQRGVEELAALHDAADRKAPPCRGDERFVDDSVPVRDLRPICERCPVFELCDAYRVAAKPPAGVWAGRRVQPRRSAKSRVAGRPLRVPRSVPH